MVSGCPLLGVSLPRFFCVCLGVPLSVSCPRAFAPAPFLVWWLSPCLAALGSCGLGFVHSGSDLASVLRSSLFGFSF